jgi:oxygen-independent coproporphyrinogen-3 oxidase
MHSPIARAPSTSSGTLSSARRIEDAAGFGIYIHWPYCEAKCPYCDFNSYARRSLTEAEYLTAALAELDYYAALTPNRQVTSIFFGGGTPSLMAAATVGALIDKVALLWPVEAGVEITLEANPSSVEAGRFAGYRAAGVNRVSLGVQSLDDAQLRFLGRLHDAAEARAAIELAGRHFDRVSFDLIYARPGQSLEAWRCELGEALQLARGHLSLYQLTIEPGTTFFELELRGKLRVPEGEDAAALYELTQEMCKAEGLPAYEISNHATPGQEGRHNLVYWRYGDYLGIGPGAHGRFTAGGRRRATAAERHPVRWHKAVESQGHGMSGSEDVGSATAAQEMLLMGLRLREGVDLHRMAALTHHAPGADTVAALRADGLIEVDRSGGRLCATAAGMLVLNALTGELAAALKPLREAGLELAALP